MHTKIDWRKLLESQEELDRYILDPRGLDYEDTSNERLLSLIVELSELANSTKSFKFWSNKKSTDIDILGEYSDVFHFMLSYMVEKRIDPTGLDFISSKKKDNSEITSEFINLFLSIKNNWEEEDFKKWVSNFLSLGASLGFEFKDIEDAFWEKRKENFKRQERGY